MNIKEISTFQAEDVSENILVTIIPTDEVCKEAAGGVMFSLIMRPWGTHANPVILKVVP